MNKIIENLPRDRATLNAWCRSFYALNDQVHNQIEEYKAETIKYMKEDFDPSFLDFIVTDFLVLGEVFVNNPPDDKISILNPDYVVVKKSITGELTIKLRPDENLRRICKSNKEEDIIQKNKIDPEIIKLIENGENIALKHLHHAAIKTSPYEIRGTSIITPYIKKIIKNKDFNMLGESVISKDVFKNRCITYASHMDNLVKELTLT